MNFEAGRSYFIERGYISELGLDRVYQGERVCFARGEGLDQGVFFTTENKRLVLPLRIFERPHIITCEGKEYDVTQEQINAIVSSSEG